MNVDHGTYLNLSTFAFIVLLGGGFHFEEEQDAQGEVFYEDEDDQRSDSGCQPSLSEEEDEEEEQRSYIAVPPHPIRQQSRKQVHQVLKPQAQSRNSDRALQTRTNRPENKPQRGQVPRRLTEPPQPLKKTAARTPIVPTVAIVKAPGPHQLPNQRSAMGSNSRRRRTSAAEKSRGGGDTRRQASPKNRKHLPVHPAPESDTEEEYDSANENEPQVKKMKEMEDCNKDLKAQLGEMERKARERSLEGGNTWVVVENSAVLLYFEKAAKTTVWRYCNFIANEK